jgi:hypothetical protein
LARDEVPVPVGLRLFLPESWINGNRCSAGTLFRYRCHTWADKPNT